MSKKTNLKSKSRKAKKRSKKNLRSRKVTKKTHGGLQKVYVLVQPTALGVRGEKEWSRNIIVNADRPLVPKLTSRILIDNDSSIDIDERIAEIVESIKDSDKLIKPLHRKMITTEILSK
jgi:hypothetical protein